MAGFTAIAAGVGLAVTAATTAASFAQMAEEKEKKKKAEDAAAAAMMEARKKLDVNYYEQLGIQKEPYELARREMLVQGAMATEALREGDPRALAAGVGRVQLAQQAGQEKVSTAMQQEQSQLEKLVAGEESRLRDLGTQLDLQEVVGAQQAMADAARAEQMALQQGLAGVTSMAGQVASMAPLYEKSPEVKAANRIQRQAKRNNIDTSTLDMSDPASLRKAGIKLTPEQWRALNKSGVKTFDEFQKYVTPEYKPAGSTTKQTPALTDPNFNLNPQGGFTNPLLPEYDPGFYINLPPGYNPDPRFNINLPPGYNPDPGFYIGLNPGFFKQDY